MKPIVNSVLLDQLHWRYATKKFDATRKIAPEDWRTLEEALVLTPSSYGLQPWRFIVVTDQATKEKLVKASWEQRQVAEASHVVVFAIKKDLNAGDVDRYLRRIAEVRQVAIDSLTGFRNVLLGSIQNPGAPVNVNDWASRQAYIALGNFMTSAALLGIDTCPMEGIEPTRYDEILGLGKEGYGSVMVCAAGFRAADDRYASLPKVRFKTDDVIVRVA